MKSLFFGVEAAGSLLENPSEKVGYQIGGFQNFIHHAQFGAASFFESPKLIRSAGVAMMVLKACKCKLIDPPIGPGMVYFCGLSGPNPAANPFRRAPGSDPTL